MMRLTAACALLAVALIVQPAAAAVPQTMSYQGVLRQADGNVVPDGIYSLTFRIYEVLAGDVPLWTEVQNVAANDGIFNVVLGSVNPIDLPFDARYELGIQVGIDPELAPRVQLTASPYAFRAKAAEAADADWSFSGDDIYRTDGSVGIGSVPVVPPESKEGKEAPASRDRQNAKLYVLGHGLFTTHSRLEEADGTTDGYAAVYGLRTRIVRNDGAGYYPGQTNNAITGYDFWGDSYTFGVAGYTYGDYPLTGGVLGSGNPGTPWGALGYKDENSTWWGVYTPGDAYVGGFRMPTGAAAGEVLTCDVTGVGSWQPASVGLGGSGTPNRLAKFTAATTLGNSIVSDDGSTVSVNGAVNVSGDGAIDGTLDVDSQGLRAGDFSSNYTSHYTVVLNAEYTGTGAYNVPAVFGQSRPADNYGYGGVFFGGYEGVYGAASTAGGGTVRGVFGEATGGSGSNYGVHGHAYGPGTNVGVYGSAGGGYNFAGYFSGNVAVSGTLYKGGGSFKIDHPLDPENKYLYHSFVESPDMMNIYNGNVVLNANGEARIQMPDWFDAVNRDFRYQLTCIGRFAPVYVAEKMVDGSFAIAGGEPGMEVSWQVTGIRQDAFANAHRIPVEENKPASERGKYLHPDLYGMPETSAVCYIEERPRPEPGGQYQDPRARQPSTGAESDGAE